MKRLMIAALLLVAANAYAIDVTQYVAALESIRDADAASARSRAQQLIGADVESPAGSFVADSALLHEIMASPQTARPHLDATIAALKDSGATTSVAKTDPHLINKLRQEEAPSALQRGGDVDLAPAGDEKTLDKFNGWIAKTWQWLVKQWEKLANWFDRWWPTERIGKERKVRGSARGLVLIVVFAILVIIAVLAYEVIRRSRATAPAPLASADPIGSKRDEDPLSRGATEWERYAAQLASAGRIREAIRAWYHAVLVTLYAAGILHFRKGRTNWEYVAALAPDLGWRAAFVTLTRRFEEEWYGRDRSSAEALEDVNNRAQEILDVVRRRAAA